MPFTAVFQKVSQGYVGFVQSCRQRTSKAPRAKRRTPICPRPVELVLETNRALAGKSIRGGR